MHALGLLPKGDENSFAIYLVVGSRGVASNSAISANPKSLAGESCFLASYVRFNPLATPLLYILSTYSLIAIVDAIYYVFPSTQHVASTKLYTHGIPKAYVKNILQTNRYMYTYAYICMRKMWTKLTRDFLKAGHRMLQLSALCCCTS